MKHSAIALTGGIGSGKSAVGSYLRQKGFVVIDCDKLSRQIATEKQVQQQVVQLLGEQFVVNGQLDRAKIRSVVFANEQLLRQYSDIFHTRIKEILTQQVNFANGVVFVEIPLIEAFDFPWQQIWLVERDLESRVSAVVKRDNVTQENVFAVISKQTTCSNFTQKILNNGTLEQLYAQVEKLLNQYNLH